MSEDYDVVLLVEQVLSPADGAQVHSLHEGLEQPVTYHVLLPLEDASARSVEDDQWKRTDPEKSARADDMVSKLESAIADIQAELDEAKAAGNEKKVKEIEENLASRQAFLDMAKKASSEFGG